MSGGHTGIPNVKEHLVPEGNDSGEPSCSAIHSFPQYELPLPGTLPSVSVKAQSEQMVSQGHRDLFRTSGSPVSLTENIATPASPHAAAKGRTPGPAAAPECISAPRPSMPSTGGRCVMSAMEIQEGEPLKLHIPAAFSLSYSPAGGLGK